MTDKITKSVQNGLGLFIVWLIATAIYIGLKTAHIDAPEFGSAYITITGGFMAGLGVIASRRNVQTQQTAQTAVKVATKVAKEVLPDEEVENVLLEKKGEEE